MRASAGRPAAAAPGHTLFSTAFGALMAAAAVTPSGPWALAAPALAAAAVLVGVFARPAAVVAVLLTIAGVAIGDPEPLFAAVSGLAATAYLLTRHGGRAVTVTTPTVLGMLGFAGVGAAATLVSARLAWAPLVAPMIVAAILAVVAAPLIAGAASRPADGPGPPG